LCYSWYVTRTSPTCFTTLHWPCRVFSKFYTSSPPIFWIVVYESRWNVWTFTPSTPPFLIHILSISLKLWYRSITHVWHLSDDTTICPLSRIFIINAILFSTNAFSNTPNNGSPSPIFSKWSRWRWWWTTPTTTTQTTNQTKKTISMWHFRPYMNVLLCSTNFIVVFQFLINIKIY